MGEVDDLIASPSTIIINVSDEENAGIKKRH